MAQNLTANPYYALDVAAARRYKLSPLLLSAQQLVESGWNPSAVSPAGAFGISQFEPSTASAFGVEPGTSPQAVATQVNGEAAYLSSLLRTEGNLTSALEAYNAGPRGVANASSNGAAKYATKILALAGTGASSVPAGGGHPYAGAGTSTTSTAATSPGTTSTGSTSTGSTSAQTTGIVGDIIGYAGGLIGSVIEGPKYLKIIPKIESFLLSLVFVVASLVLVILGVTRLFPGAAKTAGNLTKALPLLAA